MMRYGISVCPAWFARVPFSARVLLPLFVGVALGLFSLQGSPVKTDFVTERLLAIAEQEARIYEIITEDPNFYSDRDLERRINAVAQRYQNFLNAHPDDTSALILYGKLLRRMQENEQAFEVFLKADQLDPKLAVVKQHLGTHLAEQGKGEAALLFYLQAVQLEPESAPYQHGLGQLLYAFTDEFVEAGILTRDALDREMLKAFRAAAQLEPENFDFQMRLGEAYYDVAEPDWRQALLHWEKVSKHQSEPLRLEIINLHRAKVLAQLQRPEEARKLLETIENPALQASVKEVLSAIE